MRALNARSTRWALAASLALHAAGAALIVTRGRDRDALEGDRPEPARAVSIRVLPAPPREAIEASRRERPASPLVVERKTPGVEARPSPRARASAPKRDDEAEPSLGGASTALEHGVGPARPGDSGGAGPAGSSAGSVRAPQEIDLTLHPAAGPAELPAFDPGSPDGPRAASRGPGGPVLTPTGRGTYAAKDTHFRAKIAHDGELEMESRIPPPRISVLPDGSAQLELPIDANDVIYAALGEDPYLYEKMKFAAATRELRAQMADAACKERLSDSVLEIKARLDAVWRDKQRSLDDRRKTIFQLWDQCAEDGSEDVRRTTVQVRASIVAYINEHLPAASRYAYSTADLHALNQTRRSSAVFAPYVIAGRSGDDGDVRVK